jgi:hypothetical protein
MRLSRLAAAAPDGLRHGPIDTLGRRRDESWLIRRCEACERRPGESPVQGPGRQSPEGEKPKGVPGGWPH